MVKAKSEKEKWLNCAIQLFSRHFFGFMSSVQQIAIKIGMSFSV